MKIIWTDNFNRDYVDDALVAENVREHEGKIMTEALQNSCTDNGPNWYRLVPDDYVLNKFEP